MGNTVICKQGVQKRGKDTSLGSSSVQDDIVGYNIELLYLALQVHQILRKSTAARHRT